MGFFDLFKRKKPEIKVTTTISVNNEINPVYKQRLGNGLLPGEIVLLEWLNGKTIDTKPPGYFEYTFGLNATKSRNSLIEEGYLKEASPKDSLKSLKVNELKNILKENELKVSGNKSNLITRIQESLSDEETKKYIQQTSLVLTELGENTLVEYYYIVPAHKQGSKDGVYDVATAIEFVKNFKGDYKPPNGDISWTLFQKDFLKNQRNGNFGLARNNIHSMASQLYRENKLQDSLLHYLRVCIMDVSGLGNGSLNHPDITMMAPGIISKVVDIKEAINIDDKEFNQLFGKAWDSTRKGIPFHYLTEQECYQCLQHVINGNEDLVEKEITKRYKKLNRKTFEKEYNLGLPFDREEWEKDLNRKGL